MAVRPDTVCRFEPFEGAPDSLPAPLTMVSGMLRNRDDASAAYACHFARIRDAMP